MGVTANNCFNLTSGKSPSQVKKMLGRQSRHNKLCQLVAKGEHMKKRFTIAELKEFFKQKYSLLASAEIAQLMKTKENSSWEEWYEALQSYADGLGEDWERSLITDCGEKCWRESYDSGNDVQEAFKEGFRE